MDELRFDGRTAIVTGAGGNPSLGRAHAHLLAARGANVVVNDIGRDPSGRPTAEIVAAEIVALGGKAVADLHSVATVEGADAIARTAFDAFGGVDILVNNAGIACHIAIDEISPAEFSQAIDVNLIGQAWLCRAVWPHMRRQGYGRIVHISSPAFTGYTVHAAYGASKGGIFSLARSLAAEGAPLGIKVNIVNPGAFTGMVAATLEESSPIYANAKANLPAELVSPVVAFLAHEDCPVTGECIEAVGGQVRRIYIAQTPGLADRDLTLETVAVRWAEVMAGADPSIIGVGSIGADDWQVKQGTNAVAE